MPGTAVLGANLVDSLVPSVIDALRDGLHPAMGVRPFRVYTVLRTWSGEAIGDGVSSDVEAEITPQPRVLAWDKNGSLEFNLERCGLDDSGSITLTEVSLTYTYAELTGGSLAANQQFMIRVGEAHGQLNPSRYFVHTKPPYPDREQDMGWKLWLRVVQVPT